MDVKPGAEWWLEDVTRDELAEVADRLDDLRIHLHGGRKPCIAFSGERQGLDDRRLLTTLRILRSAILWAYTPGVILETDEH